MKSIIALIAVAVSVAGFSAFAQDAAPEGKKAEVKAHDKHSPHPHKHMENCGHKKVGDHYEHDGHHHKVDGEHVDECHDDDSQPAKEQKK